MNRSKRPRLRSPSISPGVPASIASSQSRSAPAMKAGLPLVMTTPLVSGSDNAASTALANSPSDTSFITFIDRPGMSQVMTAMPSSPRARVRFVMSESSNPLYDRRGPHAGTDAQRDERSAEPGPFQFIERGAKDHRTGGAKRVPHRDGTAIDVDLFGVELEELLVEQDHGGKGFVELEQVDVRRCHARALQHLARHLFRSGQHDARFRPDRGEGAHASARFELHRGASLACSEKDRGRTVDDPRGITAMMDVVDRLDLRVALHGYAVEPVIATELGEGWLEAAQGLHRCSRAHMLVALEQS